MRDIDDFNDLHWKSVTHVLFPGDVRQHFVHRGDLVFRSRGQSYSAALVRREPIATIVASPLLVIRPQPSKVEPAYLRWFLNQPTTHHTLGSIAAGTSVKIISKAALEQLEVPVPPLDMQRKIVELGELMEQETKLMAEMMRLRHRLMEKTLLREARKEG